MPAVKQVYDDSFEQVAYAYSLIKREMEKGGVKQEHYSTLRTEKGGQNGDG